MKLYFTGKGDFKVNGQSVTSTTEGKYTAVTIIDIDDISITADNFKIEYGIFSYGNQVSKISNKKLKNLIYAMYAYSQALKS